MIVGTFSIGLYVHNSFMFLFMFFYNFKLHTCATGFLFPMACLYHSVTNNVFLVKYKQESS